MLYPSSLPLQAIHPDVYRGIWGGSRCRYSPIQTKRFCECPPNQCEASNKFYEQLVNTFQYNVPISGAAALIAESIQGVSGVKEFPRYFLRKAYELIKSNNGLFISDEVSGSFFEIWICYKSKMKIEVAY